VIQTGTGEEVYRTLSGSIDRTLSNKPKEGYPESNSSSDDSSKAEDWKMMAELKVVKQQTESTGAKERKLGITWKDLTVCIDSDETPLLYVPD
jgi:hypothetical protein